MCRLDGRRCFGRSGRHFCLAVYGGLFNRAIVALLAAFIAVNIALYIARLMAAREYQKRLLLLYEALDPSAFLQALLPLRKKRMDASNRCTPASTMPSTRPPAPDYARNAQTSWPLEAVPSPPARQP